MSENFMWCPIIGKAPSNENCLDLPSCLKNDLFGNCFFQRRYLLHVSGHEPLAHFNTSIKFQVATIRVTRHYFPRCFQKKKCSIFTSRMLPRSSQRVNG